MIEVKLADIEVEYIDHCGSDLSTVNSARVSFDKQSDWEYANCKEDGNAHDKLLQEGWEDISDPEGWDYTAQRLKESDVKLIKYLAKHKHKSTFNHSFITVKVKAPLYVARQLVKHKFMPWNEISRRYVDNAPEFYVPEYYRKGAENIKQGSTQEDSGFDRHAAIEWSQQALNEYNSRLAHGICAEQARECLPLNTHTEWYWSGTLGAFADMLNLRLSSYTQKETREVAEKIRDIVLPLFPVSLQALIEYK